MRNIVRACYHFTKGENGATAIECALMLAMIVVICIVAIGPTKSTRAAAEPIVVSVPVDH